MAVTSFADYLRTLLNNPSPTGTMLTGEQQAAAEDAAAYYSDPFRRQNAIRKAAEEAAAAAATQQAMVDPNQATRGGSDRPVTRTALQDAYLDWEASTPEGRAVRDERVGNAGKALFGLFGAAMPVAGLAMAGSQLLQGKELKELTPDYNKILGTGEGYVQGYPVSFLESMMKTNPELVMNSEIGGMAKLSNWWNNLFPSNTPPAAVVDAAPAYYSGGMSPSYINEVAARYGTTPGSQQTAMLAAQEAGMFDTPSYSSGGGYNPSSYTSGGNSNDGDGSGGYSLGSFFSGRGESGD